MNRNNEMVIDCSTFEDSISDYLDKTLDSHTHKAVAEHAMSCPLCHSLLNEVRESLKLCREITAPDAGMTRLEARVLAMTIPETSMHCEEFEEHLTDYMDGFLPATLFHRWERHAVLCNSCTDLPGMVVRSIGALYTYKSEELPIPAGLNARILQATIGTERAAERRPSFGAQVAEWIRGLSFPIPVPQFASVAMMLIVAFFVFSQTVSADGSLTGVYQKSVELAEQTYKQSADAWSGNSNQSTSDQQDPVNGTRLVNQEESKQ